jgi:sterol desaturase/sphingolipid hydroxylase (fatty acid hydroxylase superfamily)
MSTGGLARQLKTMFTNPQNLETASFFVLVLIFELWERWRPAKQVDRLADLKIDLLSFAVAVAVNRVSTQAVNSIAAAVSPAFVVGWVQGLQSLPGAVKIILAIFVVDFILYWVHRAQHRFDLMWRTHTWHHTIEHMYWFAGFRTSFTHSFLNNIPQAAVPMLLFNLSPLQAGIGYSIALFIQFWEHTNVKVNVGPLRWLIITPQYHRVHHSATRHSGMNLGATFSIWDRLFGTYVDPDTMPDSFPLGLDRAVSKQELPRLMLGV